MTQGTEVSYSVISRELKNLAMTYKAMRYYSKNRNETDRIAFWTNVPNHPVRPGVAGVHYSYIVDIADETGRYTSASCRRRGYSLCGTPCWDSRPSKCSDNRLTAVIAVDSVKGVISRMLYEKGTTGDKFTVFVQHLLLPVIQGTCTRVITMDNLDGHSAAVKFIKAAGHYVVFCPTYTLEELNGFSTFWISSFNPINPMSATSIYVRPWRQQHLTVLLHKISQDTWPKPISVLRVTPLNHTWVSIKFSESFTRNDHGLHVHIQCTCTCKCKMIVN